MRLASGRWRGMLAWAVAAALLVAGLAVALGARDVLGWLAAAVLAGLAATIAGLVQWTAKKGLATGKALLLGASQPITISVEYWQQPLRFIRDPDQLDPGHLVRCGYAVLLVETAADQAVVLKRLRVLIDSRGPGTYVPPDPSHAPLALRKFLVNLDEEVPQAVPEGPARSRASIMDAYHVGTPDFPYTVSPHDPENFQVMAYTDRNDVLWRLALDWVCGGKNGTAIIDNNGQPFRVAQPEAPEVTAGHYAHMRDSFAAASGEIPSPRLVSAWVRLDAAPSERVPGWAGHWLANGHDGDALRTLAGLSDKDDPRDIRELLPEALADCGMEIPDSDSAAALVAFTNFARMHADGRASERWVLTKVCEIAARCGYAPTVTSLPLGKVSVLADEWRAGPGRTERELQAEIRQACAAQLAASRL